MNSFSRSMTVFHDRLVPEEGALLAGYMAIINAYQLAVPLPERGALISRRHKRYETAQWRVFTPRHQPDDTLSAHLTFALKYEGLDLGVLKAVFSHTGPEEIILWVQAEPTSRYSRRVWFLYEWLMEQQLNLPDAKQGLLIDVLDASIQYPGTSTPSKRHRVRNNLPGVPHFCPLVRCTSTLNRFMSMQLYAQTERVVKATPAEVLTRAAAFLLLKDSRASFQIEHENPSQQRAEHWGQALGNAGLLPLTKEELLRLQTIVLADNRFVALGFRSEGGFIGLHDRRTGMPLPDHISARWQDLTLLVDALLAAYEKERGEACDPIMLAATIAFGFVFIHPFVDGNGRIHRYLMQHILVACGMVPAGVVFPLSAVILQQLEAYKQVLENFSRPRLACISWHPTERGNIEVLNEGLF